MGRADFQHIALWCLWIMKKKKKKKRERCSLREIVNRCWSHETYGMLKRKRSTAWVHLFVTFSMEWQVFFNNNWFVRAGTSGEMWQFHPFRQGSTKFQQVLQTFLRHCRMWWFCMVFFLSHISLFTAFFLQVIFSFILKWKHFWIKRLTLLVCGFTTSHSKPNLPQKAAFSPG